MYRILETRGTFIIQESEDYFHPSLINLIIALIRIVTKQPKPINWYTPASLGKHPTLKNNLYFTLEDAQAALKLYLTEDKVHGI
jgi:hypothetical protein